VTNLCLALKKECLFYSRLSIKWNDTIFALLYLVRFTRHISAFIYTVTQVRILFLSRLNNIPLYMHDTFLIHSYFLLFTYSHVHTLFGSFSPPLALYPTLFSLPHHLQAESVLPLSLILFKRRHKHNKEDKVFLLAELRIAVQRDS
jgi:hypothetical protein